MSTKNYEMFSLKFDAVR